MAHLFREISFFILIFIRGNQAAAGELQEKEQTVSNQTRKDTFVLKSYLDDEIRRLESRIDSQATLLQALLDKIEPRAAVIPNPNPSNRTGSVKNTTSGPINTTNTTRFGVFIRKMNLVYSTSVTPENGRHAGIGFDGDDTIYFWGNSRYVDKYSLTADSVVDRISSGRMEYGTGLLDGSNNLFHFGGDLHSIFYFKLNMSSSWTKIREIPDGKYATSIVWDGMEDIYATGGYSIDYKWMTNIWRFSTANFVMETLGHFPTNRAQMSIVWDNSTRGIYTFGGYDDNFNYLDEIFKFDSSNGSLTKLDVKLPIPFAKSCAVWNGRFAFIIGGDTPSSFRKYNQMVRFDPSTKEIKEIPINNFPSRLYEHQCVFIEKLNRIYIFGGITSGYKYTSQIMYIDL